MPTGIELTLRDAAGNLLISQTNIQALWWDVTEPKDASRPVGKTINATTNASGVMFLDLSNVTGLAVGDFGFLMLYLLDGTDHKDSPTFAGKVQTSNITSGVDMYYYDSGWTRPTGWLTFTAPTTSEEKFIGLHRVYEENANFVALSAAGNYTVNWGDGTGNQNISSGVTAQTNILWANVGADTDAGIADAVACTFTDTGDTVGLTGHNYKNGEKVAFNTIVSTTGISIRTTYWVVNAATDTFQVASSQGGSALPLTTNGSGTVYRPKFRQAIVTVVPQGGQQLTTLNLHVKNNQSGLQTYDSGFIDIAISGQYLTDLRLGAQTPESATQVIRFASLEKFNLVRSNLKQCERLLHQCYALQEITDIATSTDASSSASVTFQDTGDTVTHTAHGRINGESVIFSSITSTTGITTYTRYFIVNRTTDTYQVSTAYGGSAAPLTTNGSGTAVYGTNFTSMFNSCYSLQTIPLLNTAAGTIFSSMFSSCSSLQTVPFFDLSSATSFGAMFSGCSSLSEIPPFSTTRIDGASVVFNGCAALIRGRTNGISRNISYADCKLSAAELDNIYTGLGNLGTGSVTFQVAANTVTKVGHGHAANQFVSFSSISGTTGISNSTLYRVVNPTQDTYQLSSQVNGSPIDLTGSDGTANYAPQTITVTNNWGTATDTPSIATAKGWQVTG